MRLGVLQLRAQAWLCGSSYKTRSKGGCTLLCSRTFLERAGLCCTCRHGSVDKARSDNGRTSLCSRASCERPSPAAPSMPDAASYAELQHDKDLVEQQLEEVSNEAARLQVRVTHACMCMYTHLYTWTHIHTHMLAHMRTCLRTHAHTHIHTNMK